MAFSLKPFQGTVVTVAAAGTAVQPTLLLPDNCHTVLIHNPNAAATIYVGFAPTSGTFAVADAVPVPAGLSVSLALGPLSTRPAGGAGGVADKLFFDATVTGSLANVSYVNGLSS
jgi:hypothetical protein